jgi:hypothetical protein
MFISYRLLAYIASLGLFFSLVGCTDDSGNPHRPTMLTPRSKGIQEAKALIATGTLQMKEYPPLPSPLQHGEYVKLLREKCGVGYMVPSLPAGVSEQDFIQEIRGWNDVMQSAIQQKFGADIFTQLHEEADSRWQERIEAAKKKN